MFAGAHHIVSSINDGGGLYETKRFTMMHENRGYVVGEPFARAISMGLFASPQCMKIVVSGDARLFRRR
jgi:hypothetical protein